MTVAHETSQYQITHSTCTRWLQNNKLKTYNFYNLSTMHSIKTAQVQGYKWLLKITEDY